MTDGIMFTLKDRKGTEMCLGPTHEEVMTIKNTQIAEELALPPVKIHCSILAEDAIKAAVQDYKAKHQAS